MISKELTSGHLPGEKISMLPHCIIRTIIPLFSVCRGKWEL
jgi:hypothetical protein